jgi:hypothetical protein
MKKTCFFLIFFFLTKMTLSQDISIGEILSDFLDLDKNSQRVEVMNDLEKTIKNQKLSLTFSKELIFCKDTSHSSTEIKDYIISLKFSLDSIKESQNKIEKEGEDYQEKIKEEENELTNLVNKRKIEEAENEIKFKTLNSEIDIIKNCLSILEANKNLNNLQFIQLNEGTSNSLKSTLKNLTEKSNNLDEINLVLLQTYISTNNIEDSVFYLEKIYTFLTNLYNDLSKKLLLVKNNFDLIEKDYLKIEASKQETINNIKNIISIQAEKLLSRKKEIHKLETSIQTLNLLKSDEENSDPCDAFTIFMDEENQESEKARQVVSKVILFNDTY